MSDAKGDPPKSKRSEDRKGGAAAERKRLRMAELRERRSAKLLAAESKLRQADAALRALREQVRRREALADHLDTFYAEVDKLAKGNRQIEATNLAVNQANEIIRDAKAVVAGDVYLDRVKEFVPAGENPIYPDVLLVAATVQAAVRRTKSVLAEEEKRLYETWLQAGTLAAAAGLLLEHGETPLWADVKHALGEKPAVQWFYNAEDDRTYFNLDRFDAADEEALFSTAAGE